MLDWTDRHCRYFHRLLSPNARLYTEMVTTGALIHGDRDRHLRFNEEEKYVALQLGGSEPEALAECAKMGEQYGYDEINLNCGCPSERVQKGAFGACLMAEPDLVASCVESMAKAVKIPVTVKCRIGIDDCDPEQFLRAFIRPIAAAGCNIFVIHARKAWLKGLSPKENRTKPPIDYALPAAIKKEFPHLQIIVNGEVKTVDHVRTHFQSFDGAMIGREAYQNPAILVDIEREVFGTQNLRTPQDAVLEMIPYIERQARDHGTPMKSIIRHMIGLFQGERGSRAWRRTLSVDTHRDDATPQILRDALGLVA
ncbi:MAG: tRNA dihydrouridine(20/20a) synthase DusA [Micavibrio aeruginosavorus]|uniref:tRNA-dihydrouridine(20/20a) synthase n=1 Tax=Micavibrio aeruginosavorus TaxID=349221 RepID=A0A2W5BJY6_9BACT|nr:MAG: tRNA dihydrouridine(20/20a) synthase DusA [Micavibrio aeruginosavorus]